MTPWTEGGKDGNVRGLEALSGGGGRGPYLEDAGAVGGPPRVQQVVFARAHEPLTCRQTDRCSEQLQVSLNAVSALQC